MFSAEGGKVILFVELATLPRSADVAVGRLPGVPWAGSGRLPFMIFFVKSVNLGKSGFRNFQLWGCSGEVQALDRPVRENLEIAVRRGGVRNCV